MFRFFWLLFTMSLALRAWIVLHTPIVVEVDDDEMEHKSASVGDNWQSLMVKLHVKSPAIRPIAHHGETMSRPSEGGGDRPKKVKIYIYDLGAGLQPWLNESEDIGQYSLGSVMFERLIVDPRRTRDASRANLFVVPIDLSRFTFGDGKLEPLEICQHVAEAQRIVESKKIPSSASRWERLFGSRAKSYIERNRGLDHLVPVARVASSMYWGWGKSCAPTFNWLRSLQWVTIEPPYKVDRKTGEAILDHTDSPPMGGAPRHHIVPYTTGVRLRSPEDVKALRQYQRNVNRTYLVSQSIGDHARKGSSLRANLKLACERLSPGICATDWRAARTSTLARIRRSKNSLKHFEHWLIHSTPHVALYASATFCIQPPGITPTRTAVYQCLLAGSIPVFFETFVVDALDPLFSLQPLVSTSLDSGGSSGADTQQFGNEARASDEADNGGLTHRPWAIVVSTKRATANPFAEVYGRLARIDKGLIEDMRRTIAYAAPRLQYAVVGSGIRGDAYDYAIAQAVITAERAKTNPRDL